MASPDGSKTLSTAVASSPEEGWEQNHLFEVEG